MPGIVKGYLQVLHIFLIFFLTGCAAQRYHTPVSATSAGAFPRAGSVTFVWPMQGTVLTRYGAQEDGVTSKGIVMKGPEGQEVLAAESGQVAYVDESLRGYGKTIVLEHAQGYSTVYARHSQILVNAGDFVRRGQPIARIGRDGKGSVPQLYFEMRRDTRSIDPGSVLK